MLTRQQTTADASQIVDMAHRLEYEIKSLLMNGELTDDERGLLTRASNAAGWTKSRLMGIGPADLPCTKFHADLI